MSEVGSYLQRRSFITQCSAIGACTAITASLPAAETGRSHLPSVDDFRSLIGTHFRVERESGSPLALELTEVTQSNYEMPSQFRPQFSMVFAVSVHERLPQDVYTLHHPRIGSLQLLLVPIDLPARHNNLQAVLG